MKDIQNYPLLAHNTFGMDVRAARFIEYDNVDELTDLLRKEGGRLHPLLHIGGGAISSFRALIRVRCYIRP